MKSDLSKILKITGLIPLTAFACSRQAHAFMRFTKEIYTDEGTVTKVIYDGGNPINYPLEIFIVSLVILIIYNLIKYRKIFEKYYVEEEENEISMKDLNAGQLPETLIEGEKSISITVKNIRETDANFSIPAFLKFAEFLFLQTFTHRIDLEWGGSAYYFMLHVIHTIQRKYKGIKSLTNLELISCKVEEMECYNAGTNKIILSITSTHEEMNSSNEVSSILLTEKWIFERYKGILSSPPGTQIDFYCPACQHGKSPNLDGVCTACGKNITSGKYSWVVSAIEKMSEYLMEEAPVEWEYNYAEGCLKTIAQKDLEQNKIELANRNENFDWDKFINSGISMLKKYYSKLFTNEAETLKDTLAPCFLKSQLFIRDTVQKDKKDFKITDTKISNTQLVRIDLDRFYDIATIRFWGIITTQYTENEQDKEKDKKPAIVNNYFSDYVTFFKPVKAGSESWKIALIEKEGKYNP